MATRGETKGTAKLTTSDVIAIRMSIESAPIVAERFGVGERHIRAIRARTWWKHVE